MPLVRSRYLLALVYLVAGIAWLVGSELILDDGAPASFVTHVVESSYGLAFVVVSAVLLFIVLSWPSSRPAAVGSPARARPLRPLLIFLISALSVALAGVVLYRQQAQVVAQRAGDSLASTAELTARQVELWLNGRHTGLEYAGRNPLLADALMTQVRSGPATNGHLERALEVLRLGEDFERVQVFSNEGVRLASSGGDIEYSPALARWTRGAEVTGRVVMSDLYVPDDAEGGRPVIDFVVAIGDEQRPGEWAGLLVARTDPARYLFPAINDRSGKGSNVALALAKRHGDGVVLLLTHEQATSAGSTVSLVPLQPGTAASQVIDGRKGVFEAPDYQGVPVLVTGRAIAGTPWYLVAKSELRTVYAPLRRTAWLAIVLSLAGLVTSGLLVLLWWRSERLSMAMRIAAAERRENLLKEHFAIAGRFVHDLVLLLDARDGRILEVNDRALDAYGYSREEFLAKSIFELAGADPADVDPSRQRFEATLASGAGNFLVEHRRRDGTTLPLEVSARTCDIEGRQYVQAICRDITERLAQERDLAAVAAERDRLLMRLQLQFDRMASACMVVSPEGRMLQVNPAYERIFGRKAEHVVGMHIGDLMQASGFREEVLARLAELNLRPEESYASVQENFTADGRTIVCRWNAAALRSADGSVHGYIAMADDITEQVQAERALRASEERYRSLTDISPVGIFRADLEGHTVFVNRRACAITGLDATASMGLGWARAIHPDDAPGAAAAWSRYVTGGGTVSYAEEFRFVRPDRTIVWILAQARPEHDDDGRVVAHVGTITDITALKSAQLALQQAHDHLEDRVAERTRELAAAKDAAEHSDRVKTAFLSTMSHELRTPLNSILGFTDVVLQGLSGPVTPDQARQLGIVRESAVHLRALIEDVLDISRIEAGQIGLEYGDLDLRELVTRSVASFGADAVRKGIDITFDAPMPSLPMRSDARRTKQIVNNLVSNAVKFTDHGHVRVTLQATAARVVLAVTDTGIGIDEAGLERLFNPFTQVHRPGGRLHEGTGLGLAISRELARALGGDIEVRSAVGKGSCFTFWLPATGSGGAAGAANDARGQRQADWGTTSPHAR